MRFLTAVLCVYPILVGCSSEQQAATAKSVVQVKVATAAVADVPLTVDASASIYPREQASIASKITSPIETLLVKKGDPVRPGQVIARLANRDLVAQRTEALEKAQADATSAEAALGQAQKNLDRRQDLYKQGAITAKELLATQTEATQAKANYDAASRYLALLKGSTASDSNNGTADPPQTAYLNAQLEFTEIRSPLAGTVTEQFLYPGDMAKPEAPIFTLMDLSTAVARAQVHTDEIMSVKHDQSCSFVSADLQNHIFKGHVSVINEAADPQRRTVEVWCEIPNPLRELKAGMFGNVTISVGNANHSIVLPASAVLFQEGSAKGTVVIVDPQHVAHVREVDAVSAPNGRVRVLRGVIAGDTVVTEGGYGLPDGTQVTLTTADGGK